MFKRYEQCWGLSFPSIGKWKIEFWLAMPNYQIRSHTHSNEDIWLVFLFGHNIIFHRRKRDEAKGVSFFAKLWNIGNVFKIPAGAEHWFEVSTWPLFFMNIERWKDGIKPTSASEDLQLT